MANNGSGHRLAGQSICFLAIIAAFFALTNKAAAEAVTYYYTSPQGTVLAKADGSGNPLGSADYTPYGAQVIGVAEGGPGYTGHVQDVETVFVYMQARYYDPQVGRFLSVDPKPVEPGNILTLSRFAYADLNPSRYIDPDGRQSWCAPGTCGQEAYRQTADKVMWFRNNFDAVFEAKGAYGPGIEISVNFSQSKSEINILPAAQGLEMSMSLQAKDPIVVPLVRNAKDGNMGISWGGGVDVAFGLKLGTDLKFDPGGKLELTPKFGVGVGEFSQFAPSINLLEFQPRADESQKPAPQQVY